MIRLGMVGMVEGNGHPYSWSAIINGYNAKAMEGCPYPVIPRYLEREPEHNFGMPGVKVTHIWTDRPEDAPKVAEASLIPNVADRPEDIIGAVDAVIIATDKGEEHADRCRPFIEAGIPVFIDKPLTDNEDDLKTFCRWVDGGARIMSSSSMRYCKEYMPYRAGASSLGSIRYAGITTPKSWERYGIHALEGAYTILGPGVISVRNTGMEKRNIVHIKHSCGADIVVAAIYDMSGSFGDLTLGGTAASVQVTMQDTFYSFKAQLEAFVQYLRTGTRPYPFSETVELMKIIIAGIRSRNDGGREVLLSEIALEG